MIARYRQKDAYHDFNIEDFIIDDSNIDDFNIDDPVPDDDEEFGVVNKGHHVVFNAVRDDEGFVLRTGFYDVVADGNQAMSRRLCDDEKEGGFLKGRLRGRPKGKTQSKGMKAKRTIQKKLCLFYSAYQQKV